MRNKTCMLAAVGLLAVAGTASAGIASWSGQLQLVGQTENPVSFEFGAMANDEVMSLYVEALGHTLDQPLMSDINGDAGTYHRHNRPSTLTEIPAGTSIDSYFIHQDLVGTNPNKVALMTFSITFEQPILGLIIGGDWADASLLRTTLDDSDFLGGPEIEYTQNTDGHRRGALEGLASAEFLTISDDGYTLSGSLHTRAIHVDNVRIITQGSFIPTPGAVVLLGIAGVVTARRRRA